MLALENQKLNVKEICSNDAWNMVVEMEDFVVKGDTEF